MDQPFPVLVTGSAGFIGSYLMMHLIQRGIHAIGVDRRASRPPSTTQVVNLLDDSAVRTLLKDQKPSYIFHLAGAVGTDDKTLLNQAHVQTTRVLLESVHREVPDCRVIILGSAAEYGCSSEDDAIISEFTPPNPRSAYGQSKLEQKQTAVQLASKWNLDLVHVRLFNTMGPGQGAHLVAGAMVQRLFKAIHGHTAVFDVYDPYSERDFLDVRDIARLLWSVALGDVRESPQTSVHICSGQGSSILQLARYLYHAAGLTEADLPLQLLNEQQPTRCVGSTKILRQLLADEPIKTISLQKMMQDMWLWQNSHQKSETAEMI